MWPSEAMNSTELWWSCDVTDLCDMCSCSKVVRMLIVII